tara:strand:+ start:3629 stop:3799 length:171 start_codon:yes stop_codon:yes gene_type:complete
LKYDNENRDQNFDDVAADYLEFLKMVDPNKFKELLQIEELLSQHNQLMKKAADGHA